MEIRKSVDQRQCAIDAYFARHAERLARQGTIVATFRRLNGRRLGPYFRLTCRAAEQRQVAQYLGPEGPIVADARRRLAQLQQPHAEQVRWTRLRQALRREAQRARRKLSALLAQHGLTRKGAEIRGWRGMP